VCDDDDDDDDNDDDDRQTDVTCLRSATNQFRNSYFLK